MSFLKHWLIGLVGVILFIISFVVYGGWWPTATAARPAFWLDGIGTTQIYLPITLNKKSPTPSSLTVFGAQVLPRSSLSRPITLAVEANISFIRYDKHVWWGNIEPIEGERDWSQLSSFEEEMVLLSENGLTPIVIVRSAPPWAQKVPNFYCGPIKEDALDDFADFMHELVERYSQPPYNVIYWEIWNEPDIDSVLLTPGQSPVEQPFGCWGDGSDPYYGGGYYGEMLKQVYPAMKEANPAVQVLIGGLNLDCDPTAPPEGETCLAAKFLEGILNNEGGNYFDLVSYHGYAFWWPTLRFTGDWALEHPVWSHRGGVTLGKADFLRQLLAQYGVDKPLLLSETSLACHERNPYCQCDDPKTECLQEEFFDAQANYALRLYTRVWANGLLGATWHTLNYNGWRHTDLIDRNQDPKPAYTTVQFLATLLEGATYRGEFSTFTVEGYRFSKEQTEYHIYWTNNLMISEPLLLPENTQVVYNKFGEQITPSGTSITVGFEPIIIQKLAGDEQ